MKKKRMEIDFLIINPRTGETLNSNDLREQFSFTADMHLALLQAKLHEIKGQSQTADQALGDAIKMQKTFCFFAKTTASMPMNHGLMAASLYMRTHQNGVFSTTKEILKYNIR